jgi:hypothetical protein
LLSPRSCAYLQSQQLVKSTTVFSAILMMKESGALKPGMK